MDGVIGPWSVYLVGCPEDSLEDVLGRRRRARGSLGARLCDGAVAGGVADASSDANRGPAGIWRGRRLVGSSHSASSHKHSAKERESPRSHRRDPNSGPDLPRGSLGGTQRKARATGSPRRHT